MQLLLLLAPLTVPQQGEPEVRPPLPSAEEIAALPPDGGDGFNRLVFEDSPYLLQHARNPVDWYPWGEEAFAAARAADKPVFLSVGYSTCHWCHVMEHESFEDEEVAALMNRAFVCIKVDREERPDVDHVYMSVTQALTGSGGWPMTVLMTPDQEPFFAATYIPKDSRFGRHGMLELVPAVEKAWQEDREGLLANAAEISRWMQQLGHGEPGEALTGADLETAYAGFEQRFDAANGGFGTQPKFPVPHDLLFLLQYHRRHENTRALEMVTRTLRAMRQGGIYDHVGFGFHRYSTDARWFLPHFEKMLYDQALLTLAYTAGWQMTGEPLFERTAREVLEYVERDMTAPEGGFYSAEDADSEGEEGRFYVWTRAELAAALGEEEGAHFADTFGATEEGNYLEEASRQRTGANVLFLTEPPLADERLERARQELFALREQRVHPLKDDKVLTDWNGLMIAAFAHAGQAFGDESYTATARRAADFALSELVTEDYRLAKRWRAGQAGLPGTLSDHAFLVFGLLELYEASFDVRYLESALGLTDAMVAHFSDREKGGFFLSADDAGELLAVRGKESYDGAIPSGNSLAVLDLVRLARMTGRTEYEDHAERAMRAHAGAARRNPTGHSWLWLAADLALGPSFEVVVAGDLAAEDTRALLSAFQAPYAPNKVLLHRPPGANPRIVELAPFTEFQGTAGPATVFVCRDFACRLPTSDVEEALGFLDPAAWEE